MGGALEYKYARPWPVFSITTYTSSHIPYENRTIHTITLQTHAAALDLIKATSHHHPSDALEADHAVRQNPRHAPLGHY